MEKRIRQRLELRQTYEAQLAFKKIVLQALQEEEETFRQKMLAKFAEDDRIEQMNAQKRRMKQLEHRKAVEKLIEERHKQFLADKVRGFSFFFSSRFRYELKLTKIMRQYLQQFVRIAAFLSISLIKEWGILFAFYFAGRKVT